MKYNTGIPKKITLLLHYFNGGESCNVGNDRLMCIHFAMPTVLEQRWSLCLNIHLQLLFLKYHHGFTKGTSTLTNLFSYTEFISKVLDQGYEVHSLYTDFSKAFDIVDQKFKSGVLQGSHLDPRLILILINDIGHHIGSYYLLFADDLKIFRCKCRLWVASKR